MVFFSETKLGNGFDLIGRASANLRFRFLGSSELSVGAPMMGVAGDRR